MTHTLFVKGISPPYMQVFLGVPSIPYFFGRDIENVAHNLMKERDNDITHDLLWLMGKLLSIIDTIFTMSHHLWRRIIVHWFAWCNGVLGIKLYHRWEVYLDLNPILWISINQVYMSQIWI